MRRSRIASARRRCPSVTNSIGLKSIDARCKRLLGLGNRSTLAAQPAAAIATRKWSSTAPQPISASRPEWSVEYRTPVLVEEQLNCASSATQCHGWLLCSDGARQANCTASLMTSVSTMVSRMSQASG